MYRTPRKVCPHCKERRPSYLMESHVKNCTWTVPAKAHRRHAFAAFRNGPLTLAQVRELPPEELLAVKELLLEGYIGEAVSDGQAVYYQARALR